MADDARWQELVDSGNASYSKRRVAQAEVFFLDALKEAEKFGEDDPRLAMTLNNMAAIYHSQGKYAMAEPMYQRSLEIKKRVLGPEHLDVATCYHNLAVLHSAKHRYAEAETYYQQALAIREAAWGKDHPDLAGTLKSYAELLRRLERLDEAEQLEARLTKV